MGERNKLKEQNTKINREKIRRKEKRDKERDRKREGESGEKAIQKDKKFQTFASKSVANSPKVIQK